MSDRIRLGEVNERAGLSPECSRPPEVCGPVGLNDTDPVHSRSTDLPAQADDGARRADQLRARAVEESGTSWRELDTAVPLVGSTTAGRDPSDDHDAYRHEVEELIEAGRRIEDVVATAPTEWPAPAGSVWPLRRPQNRVRRRTPRTVWRRRRRGRRACGS